MIAHSSRPSLSSPQLEASALAACWLEPKAATSSLLQSPLPMHPSNANTRHRPNNGQLAREEAPRQWIPRGPLGADCVAGAGPLRSPTWRAQRLGRIPLGPPVARAPRATVAACAVAGAANGALVAQPASRSNLLAPLIGSPSCPFSVLRYSQAPLARLSARHNLVGAVADTRSQRAPESECNWSSANSPDASATDAASELNSTTPLDSQTRRTNSDWPSVSDWPATAAASASAATCEPGGCKTAEAAAAAAAAAAAS